MKKIACNCIEMQRNRISLASILACVIICGFPSFVQALPTISESLTITNPEQPFDGFGTAVALSGSLGIIGQQINNDVAPTAGAAYLANLTTGQILDKLLPPDGGESDRFGIAVDMIEGTAIVGAHQHSPNSPLFAGAAYLFDTTDPKNASLRHRLVPSDSQTFAQFGDSVAIDGLTAIVGAAENQEVPFSPGSAYVFNIDSGLEIAKLNP